MPDVTMSRQCGFTPHHLAAARREIEEDGLDGIMWAQWLHLDYQSVKNEEWFVQEIARRFHVNGDDCPAFGVYECQPLTAERPAALRD